MIFQFFNLLEDLTVADNVLLPAQLAGTPRRKARARAVLAGLGVLISVLMVTRERVHDLGVFKAVGMTPRQTIAMVTCWVVAPAIAAAVIGLPAGTALHATVMAALAKDVSFGLSAAPLPPAFINVYGTGELALLALAGLAIAAAGALVPAAWAAVSRTSTALHTE